MKRILALLLIAISIFTLAGCGTKPPSPEEIKQETLSTIEAYYNEEKYQEILDTLSAVEADPDYQIWSDRAQAHLYYAEEKYADVIETLKSYEEQDEIYRDSYKKLFDAALTEAVETQDIEAVQSAVQEYVSATGDEDTVGEKLAAVLSEISDKQNDDAFRFAERLVSSFSDFSFQNQLETILNDSVSNRVCAFLRGDWIRRDGSINTGIQLNVKISENGSIIGAVTSSPETVAFKQGSIKWKDFEVFDKNNITLYDLATTGSYAYSSGLLDYDANSMCILVSPSYYTITSGAQQYWVKKEYVDRYSSADPISVEDFVFELWNSDAGEMVTFDSTGPLRYMQPEFYFSDPESGIAPSSVIKTARGITLGATQEEVAAAYGIGAGKKYISDTDTMRAYLKNYQKDSALSVYDQQDYQLVYSDPSTNFCLVFCFNENHEVIMILVSPSFIYWKNA